MPAASYVRRSLARGRDLAFGAGRAAATVGMGAANATAFTARAAAGTAAATAIVGGALGVGGAVVVGAGMVMGAPMGLLEARRAGGQWKRGEEAAYMSSLISNAQVGPFGTGNRPYGMGSNYGNAAGMTLALHYARNGTGIKDPFMQMMGGLAGGRAGRFVGSF